MWRLPGIKRVLISASAVRFILSIKRAAKKHPMIFMRNCRCCLNSSMPSAGHCMNSTTTKLMISSGRLPSRQAKRGLRHACLLAISMHYNLSTRLQKCMPSKMALVISRSSTLLTLRINMASVSSSSLISNHLRATHPTTCPVCRGLARRLECSCFRSLRRLRIYMNI
ncbi:hypothetical protein D3C85_991500 [compost metagenome]